MRVMTSLTPMAMVTGMSPAARIRLWKVHTRPRNTKHPAITRMYSMP